jgi:outer membrane lipoprotein-sorting protein
MEPPPLPRSLRPLVLALSVVLLALAPAAFGKELTVEELRQTQSKLKTFDSLSVAFTQDYTKGLRGKTTTREGKALFDKSGRFKWMLETPVQEYKLYDGKYFYDYNPSAKSAQRYSPTGTQAYELKQIVDLVLNFDSLLRRYDLEKAEETGGLIKIDLKPKSEGELTGVHLDWSVADNYIPYLKMTFRNKAVIALTFKSPSRKAIPPSEFDLPKGVKATDSL